MSTYLERLCQHRPTPDFTQLATVLAKKRPSRDTLFEFFLNEPLEARLAGVPTGGDDAQVRRRRAQGFCQAGYDYLTLLAPSFHFTYGAVHSEATLSLNDGAVIRDRETFENYGWPEVDAKVEAYFEQAGRELPEGMKMIVYCPNGVLENVIRLVGYDNLCFLSLDDPSLLQDIFDQVGVRLERYLGLAAQLDCVGACISNDDWGFKTQPMLPPADLRQYVFPWHKRIVQAVHAAGKPCILHSCGNAAEIWDDIIDGIGFDAKHSYEDTIEPVEDAYEAKAGRIAILGGMDVDFVIRSSPDAVYRRAKAMLERASVRGGYALGTGNSVPEYIPMENYAAMAWAAVESRR